MEINETPSLAGGVARSHFGRAGGMGTTVAIIIGKYILLQDLLLL